MPFDNGTLEAPTKLSASDNYDNYVELNWKYPVYKHANFIIYRGDMVLDTISHEYRSYKDYDAVFGVEYIYKVRALMDNEVSPHVIAIGQKMAKHTIAGHIFTHDQLNGIGGTEVKVTWRKGSEILHYINTVSDVAGLYVLEDVPYFSEATSVTIEASKTNHQFDSRVLNVSKNNLIYSDVNFIDNVAYTNIISKDYIVTPIKAVSAFADDIESNVEISWKPQNSNFDGFIIYRDYEPIMKYNLHSGNYTATDSLGSPGHEYIYSVQPFWNSPIGYQQGEVVDIPSPVLYPGYAIVTQVTAVAKRDSNHVEVYWSHIGEATYYEVYRSEELIDVVYNNNKHKIIDSTGVPGLSYKYRVRSFNGDTKKYSNFNSTSLTYPELIPPVNFVASTDETMNEVDLQWGYKGKYIDGYVIFRNKVKQATINDPAVFNWTDTTGIPESWHEYEVVAFRKDNTSQYYSDAAVSKAFYPELENVGTINYYTSNNSLSTAEIPDSLVTLTWNYTPENIEGFYLYRSGELLSILNKKDRTYRDEFGLPGQDYTYTIIAYDFRGDDLKEYHSDSIWIDVKYPHYPVTSDITTSQSSSYAKLNWSYNWSYIDGFIISRGHNTNNLVEYDTIPSWSREYYDHINVCGNTKAYSIEPYRLINESYVTSNLARKTTSNISLSACNSDDAFENFTASKGEYKDKVKLSWTYKKNATVKMVTIERASANGSFVEIAEKNSQWNAYTDENVVDGQIYQYRIKPWDGGAYDNSLTAEGYSQPEGQIRGLVQSYKDKSALPGISIRAFAMIDGVPYSYATVTNSKGIYSFEELYMKPGATTTYTITARYENHNFLNNGQEVNLSDDMKQNSTDKTIYDLQSKTISGRAFYANQTKCMLDSVKLTLHYIDAFDKAFTENAYSNKEGEYSFIIKALDDIVGYGVKADGYLSSNSQIAETWHFAPDSIGYGIEEVEYSVHDVNFEDTTTYQVNVDIANGCGMPLGDFNFEVAIESANGCFYETYSTDASGNLNVKLPPLDYTFRVMDAIPLDINSQPIIDYFRVRPAQLNLGALHKERVSAGITAFVDTSIAFTFHKVPEIRMTASSFEDPQNVFNCKLEGLYLAVEDSSTYSDIQFAVLEEYDGDNCPVSGGYLIVKNNAANGNHKVQRVDYNPVTGMFNPYSFKVGDPNPVAPFYHSMSVEYFSEGGEFLADMTKYIIVTGDTDIEGKDVLVVPDNKGDEIQLPLFVLRDPPGDKSYSYIDKEVGITKSISAKKSDGLVMNLDEEAKIGVFTCDILQEYHAQGDIKSDESYNISLSVKTNEKISTTSSPILSVNDKGWIIGENADVVVGLGIALQTGIAENITLVKDNNDQCMALNYLKYQVSTDSISTQWVYSESQIRNIIRNYDEILEDKIGSNYDVEIKNNNKDYGRDTMAFYYAWKNWQEIHNYYKVKTLPHYLLCADKYDSDTDGDIKNFCENFFTFNDNDLITGLNTSKGKWNNKWMDIYNSEMSKSNKEYISLMEEANWDVLDYNKIGELFTIESQLNPISISDQFANNKEEAKRVFEEQYTGAGIENITFTGGTKYQKQVSSKIQGKYNYSQYYGFQDKWGLGAKAEIEIKLKAKFGVNAKTNAPFVSVGPFGATEHELALKSHYALMLKGGQTNKVTFTENSGIIVDSTYKVGYVLSDDDDGDQFSTMVIKGTIPGHTPYFDLIGGRSTCPYEKGTIDRNNIEVSIVDKEGNPTNNAQYNLDPDEPTVFYARISNNNPFGEDLIVDISGMPMGADETENINKIIYGEKIRPTKRVPLFLPVDSSLIVDIFVDRINPMEYDYPNIELLVRPHCESSPFYGDTLNFAAFFRKPCSNISITEPESGWVINKSLDGFEENLSMKLMDYTVDGKIFNLDSIVVEYRREGSNEWTYMTGATFHELAEYYETFKTVYKEPMYPVIWNITNNDDIIDGNYEIRAMAECGTGGYTFSNVISGTVDRTSLQVFKSSPSNGVLSLGEYISVLFNDNIDRELLEQDSITVTTPGGTKVAYELFADGNEITLKLDENQLHALHDSTLTARVAYVFDKNGNQLEEPYSWSFKVNYSPVYFNPVEMVKTMQREEVKHAEVTLKTNWESIGQFVLKGYDTSWITVINEYGVEIPEGTSQLFRQGERNINLVLNSHNLWPGEYTDTIYAEVDGYNSTYMVVTLNVLSEPVDWKVDASKFDLSMGVITNFKLATETDQILNGQYVLDVSEFSTDTLDMVAAYIDNELRGAVNISKVSDTRYAAYLTVLGNKDDLNKEVKFSVYDSSTGIEYDATPESDVKFSIDRVYGSSAFPEPLMVTTQKQRVRYIHFDQGWNMFSINGLPDDPHFDAVFAGLELTDGDLIKDHNSQEMAQYSIATNSWISAGVDTITPGYGYWIYLDKANVLKFSGDESRNYNSFNLDSPEGWFMVGSPVQSRQAINSTLTFKESNVSTAIIKSADGLSEYRNGTWEGSLTEVRPFEAYKVNANAEDILKIAGGISKIAYPQKDNLYLKSASANTSTWNVEPSAYEHSLSITGEVVGTIDVSQGDQVIAFDEDDIVRGVGKLNYIQGINKHLVTMLVYGTSEESLKFKYHSVSKNLTYNISNFLSFKVNDRVGKISDAYPLIVDESSAEMDKDHIDVYPNPFNDVINFNLFAENEGEITVSLVDLLGRVVIQQNMDTRNGMNYLQMDVSKASLLEGVYILKITSGENVLKTMEIIKSK